MRYLAIALAILATPTFAAPVEFDANWEDLTFRGINATEYGYNGNTLVIQADNSSSVTYKSLPPTEFDSTQVSWNWAVSSSVPVTDLTRKGGDDRNVTIYFMFLDRKSANKMDADVSLSKMLRNRKVRMLLYIWGGEGVGTSIPSPYFKGRGFYTVLRDAGTGEAQENIDLAADYTRIFGEPPEALVGIAISSDSDDTNSSVRAQISEMVLE